MGNFHCLTSSRPLQGIFLIKVVQLYLSVALGEVFAMHAIHIGMASHAEAFQVLLSVVGLDAVLVMHVHKPSVPRILYLHSTSLASPVVLLSYRPAEPLPVSGISEDIDI